MIILENNENIQQLPLKDEVLSNTFVNDIYHPEELERILISKDISSEDVFNVDLNSLDKLRVDPINDKIINDIKGKFSIRYVDSFTVNKEFKLT